MERQAGVLALSSPGASSPNPPHARTSSPPSPDFRSKNKIPPPPSRPLIPVIPIDLYVFFLVAACFSFLALVLIPFLFYLATMADRAELEAAESAARGD